MDFNRYGLVVEGDVGWYKENPHTGSSDRFQVAVMDYPSSEIWEIERYVTSVSFYDYGGNKIESFSFAEEEIIEQGYHFTKVIYDYEAGILTGFYVQDETDRLYISQVQWRPNNLE